MKIESIVKVKKHIPYRLLTFVNRLKKTERNKYNINVDYSSLYPLKQVKHLLLTYSKEIHDFMTTIDTNPYKDLQTEIEKETFKECFIHQIAYFFKEEEQAEIFMQIDYMHFNIANQNCFRVLPGLVLKTTLTNSKAFKTKENCLQYADDLRSFFDQFFLCKQQTNVYGIYPLFEKFDQAKIQFFIDGNLFSTEFIQDIRQADSYLYFQKYGKSKCDFHGIISYRVVQETIEKLQKK